MRLSTTELHALRSILGALDPAGRIYLYGSRANDMRRGGDIDVYPAPACPDKHSTRTHTQLAQTASQVVAYQNFMQPIGH